MIVVIKFIVHIQVLLLSLDFVRVHPPRIDPAFLLLLPLTYLTRLVAYLWNLA